MIHPSALWIPLLCMVTAEGCGDPPPLSSAVNAPDAVDSRTLPGMAPVSAEADGDLPNALRSLAFPGWGQKRQARSHWWVYPVVEAIGFAGWFEGHRSGDRHRDRYRDQAWESARSHLWDGPRADGAWEYYETMGTWAASGVFDRTPDPSLLVPESDPSTYNGAIWQLARQIHLPPNGGEADPDPENLQDPDYQRALDYYRERAIPPEFAWDWAGDAAALERFRSFVRASDDGFRRATGFLGLVFLNHFISATEAWITRHPGPLESLPLHLTADALPRNDRGGVSIEFRISSRTPRSLR